MKLSWLLLFLFIVISCKKATVEKPYLMKATNFNMVEYENSKATSVITADLLIQYKDAYQANNFKAVAGSNVYSGSQVDYDTNNSTATIADGVLQMDNNTLKSQLFNFDNNTALLTADVATIEAKDYRVFGQGFVYNLHYGAITFEKGGEGEWQQAEDVATIAPLS